MKFMTIVYGLIFFVVGAVIVLTVLPAILPSFYAGLNTTYGYQYCQTGWNATAGTCTIGTEVIRTLPLRDLFALNGIIPLVLVAAVFVALIVGAIALIKSGNKNR